MVIKYSQGLQRVFASIKNSSSGLKVNRRDVRLVSAEVAVVIEAAHLLRSSPTLEEWEETAYNRKKPRAGLGSS